MRYSVTPEIDADPRVIWELLTRAPGYPEWNRAVLWIEGQVAGGETIRLTSIVDPDPQFKLMVSEVEAPGQMAWSDGMALGLFRGTRSFDVVPRGDGKSEFRMEEVYTGLMAPLITRSIADMTQSFEMFADGLNSAAESK